MALITFSAMVTDARNAIGGTVFARNKGGAYTRARIAPINRATPTQSVVRASFAVNSKYWSSTLTAAQRTSWTNFAAANPVINSLGASIILSGLAMFQKLTQVLASIGVAPVAIAPTDMSVAPLAASTGATAVSGTSLVKVQTDAQTVQPDAEYYIFATSPLAPGKTPGKSGYRLMGAYPAVAAAVDVDISTAYVASFGAWNPGASIGIAVATVNNTTGAVTPAIIYNISST